MRQAAPLGRAPLGLMALGVALCAFIALGAPALCTYGDNAFCALMLASGGVAAWATARVSESEGAWTLALILAFGLLMRLIVLPQAITKTIPPLGNTALNLIKNSSLVSTISMLDILGTANLMGSRSFQYVPMFVGAGICYLILTLPAAFAVNVLERRYAR